MMRYYPTPDQIRRQEERNSTEVIKLSAHVLKSSEGTPAEGVQNDFHVVVASNKSLDVSSSSASSAPKNTTETNIDVKPLQCFEPFVKLPRELREGILVLTIPDPRKIRLHSTRVLERVQTNNQSVNSSNSKETSVTPFAGTPVITNVPWTLLHTSIETREFALKHYKLAFEKELWGKPIYIDFSRDKLEFGWYALEALCGIPRPWYFKTSDNDLELLIRHLPSKRNQAEIELRSIVLEAPLRQENVILLSRFQKLEKLVVRKDEIYVGLGCVRTFRGYRDPEPMERLLKKCRIDDAAARASPPPVAELPVIEYLSSDRGQW